MGDILTRADAFRLGTEPTDEDVNKANLIIDRQSAEIAQLREQVRIEKEENRWAYINAALEDNKMEPKS